MQLLRRCLTFVLATLFFQGVDAHAATIYFKARLDGAQAGVSTNADGSAFLSYDNVLRQLRWTVNYRNLSSAGFAAHIHGPARPGVDGGIVVPFTFTPSPLSDGGTPATITVQQEADLLNGLWYVNIHTNNFPNGEIRGQIYPLRTTQYNVPVDGVQAGSPGTPNATSATGSGTVTLDPATLQMTWNLTYSNMSSAVFAAHFHGPARLFESAGIQVGTGSTPPITGSTTLTAALAAELINGFWYFNIHSNNFPNGEIRGQVLPIDPRLFNISTRMQVLTGNDVMIAGFIVGGPFAKTMVVNVAGPSLTNAGISNPLQNPTLTLVRSSDNAVIASNDDWQSQSPSSVNAIQASGFQPNNALEPAIIATLAPGAYTAIVQGVSGGTGVGLVGLFEVDHPEVPLINISTRGQVLTGNDVMIAGFIIQGGNPQTVVVNVAGPSLANSGIANPLQNPTLTLVRSSDNAVIATNDDWQTQSAANVAAIQASGFQPNNALEPAIIATLQPGAYTAIVQGVGGGTGVGLVGVFAVP